MAYRLTRTLTAVAAAFCLGVPALAQQEAPSAYGCSHLDNDPIMPIFEGEDGVFYRIYSDLRMYHPFSDTTVELLGQLSDVLRENGTTLVFLPVPTKSQVMQEYMTDRSELYGFDHGIATAIYKDIVDRLNTRGLITIDGQDALREGDPANWPFFGPDFHWTAEGARRAAVAIDQELERRNLYEGLTRKTFETVETGEEVAFSGLRRVIQKQCRETIPQATTMTYETTATEGGDSAAVDLFGNAASIDLVLIGTSFSDMEISHFEGWLKQYTGLEVINYAITGGNQYGAMLSYLTSQDFRDNRPRILVWENPLYNNLMQNGDQPLREFIAAAGNSCSIPLETERVDQRSLKADLAGMNLKAEDMIHAFAGGEGSRIANFVFETADGQTRQKELRRDARLRPTGNYYMPVNSLISADIASVTVKFDRTLPQSATLNLCRKEQEQL